MTRILVAATTVFSALFCLSVVTGQEPQPEHPRFRVSVDAVRIDAVVTDRDGRIVTDLTADDFEVLQDGKPHKVTFAQFVPVASSPDPRRTTTPRPAKGTAVELPPVPAPAATRASVQRTLAIVIDDLGMSVESLFYIKRGLHTFIDRDIQPTDLVGILRTGGSVGALQPFTTDRRMLHNTIDALRWNGFSRSHVEAFEALNTFTTFDNRSNLDDPTDFAKVNAVQRSMSASGTLGALQLAIQGARDLPGRKSIVFVSEGFKLTDEEGQIDSRVRDAFDRAIDQATRAGVVIYSLDPRGLATAGIQASDNLKSGPLEPDGMDQLVRTRSEERRSFNRSTQETLAYLAERTGGFAVMNTNDLGLGLGRIAADIRDYYVIGYLPDKGTFLGKGKKPLYHKITVKVRRPGLRVRTRKEFLGVSDAEGTEVPTTPGQQLIRAAISPFVATEIVLRSTALPWYVQEKGLLVRTLLHIDARGLSFVAGDDGKKTASADVLGMVFDRDGTEVAHLSTGFSVALSDDATDEALRDGLLYTLSVPIPRAGAYQMRFAVRDRQTGKLGTAGEFIEIADVAKKAFALSGIILGTEGNARFPGSDGSVVSAAQARREYQPGTRLTYSFEIYNPAEQVQVNTSIWRGAQKVATFPISTLRPAAMQREMGTAGDLKLGEQLPPGNYVLQVAAVTGETGAKRRLQTALQRIDFDVR